MRIYCGYFLIVSYCVIPCYFFYRRASGGKYEIIENLFLFVSSLLILLPLIALAIRLLGGKALARVAWLSRPGWLKFVLGWNAWFLGWVLFTNETLYWWFRGESPMKLSFGLAALLFYGWAWSLISDRKGKIL